MRVVASYFDLTIRPLLIWGVTIVPPVDESEGTAPRFVRIADLFPMSVETDAAHQTDKGPAGQAIQAHINSKVS